MGKTTNKLPLRFTWARTPLLEQLWRFRWQHSVSLMGLAGMDSRPARGHIYDFLVTTEDRMGALL